MSPRCFVHSIIQFFIKFIQIFHPLLIFLTCLLLPSLSPLFHSSLKLYLRTFTFFRILCFTLFHKISSILPSSSNLFFSPLLSSLLPLLHLLSFISTSLLSLSYLLLLLLLLLLLSSLIAHLSVSVWSRASLRDTRTLWRASPSVPETCLRRGRATRPSSCGT